jgi:hypothetical protein
MQLVNLGSVAKSDDGRLNWVSIMQTWNTEAERRKTQGLTNPLTEINHASKLTAARATATSGLGSGTHSVGDAKVNFDVAKNVRGKNDSYRITVPLRLRDPEWEVGDLVAWANVIQMTGHKSIESLQIHLRSEAMRGFETCRQPSRSAEYAVKISTNSAFFVSKVDPPESTLWGKGFDKHLTRLLPGHVAAPVRTVDITCGVFIFRSSVSPEGTADNQSKN